MPTIAAEDRGVHSRSSTLSRHGVRSGRNEAFTAAFNPQFGETWSNDMTYGPNDLSKRPVDEDLRSTADRPGPYTRNPSNTGVIVGVLAVVAIVFFVWRGYDNTTSPNTGATNSTTSSSASTAAPSRPAGTPAAPAPGAAAPDTTGTTTTAPRPQREPVSSTALRRGGRATGRLVPFQKLSSTRPSISASVAGRKASRSIGMMASTVSATR